MDPLSITASIVGIISLGIQITQSLVDFYSACKNQKKEINDALEELQRLLGILDLVRNQLEKRKFDTEADAALRKEIETLVQECQESLQELHDEYAKFGNSSRTLPYPFRKSTLQRLQEDVEDIISRLSQVLQLLGLKDTANILTHVEETTSLLQLVRADQISTSIRDWLRAPDATINYNEIRTKRHPSTGLWLVDGLTFSQWLQQPSSALWLYGFAGCGKSVLSCTIIQQVHQYRQQTSNTGIAFFFFTFNDDAKRDVSAMLRALILQLSGQLDKDCRILSQLHENHRHSTPYNEDLLGCLLQLVRSFKHTYIILDALDECPLDNDHREKILQTLSDILGWLEPGLHLLVTSRDEPDIREFVCEMGLSPDYMIPLRNTHVKNDIATFVTSSLKSDRRLKTFNEKYHQQIHKALTDGADGVFRWVECQLNSLRSCPKSKRNLDKLLKALPKSLDETYERILLDISTRTFADDARRVLAFLCCSRRPLRVSELLESLAIQVGSNPHFDPDARLDEEGKIHRICPGLIDVDTFLKKPTVRIAHYSVQEYLESDRICRSKVSSFGISRPRAHAEIAKICLAYLLDPLLSDPASMKEPKTQTRAEIQPLYPYAEHYWAIHAYLASPRPPMARELLSTPSKLPQDLLRVLLISYYGDPETEATICWLVQQGVPTNIYDRHDRSPLHYAVFGKSATCVRALLEHGTAITVDVDNMTPFHYTATVSGGESLAQIFLDAKQPIDVEVDRVARSSATEPGLVFLSPWNAHSTPSTDAQIGLTALHLAVVTRSVSMTRYLLDKGANPNSSSGCGETPLHCAVKPDIYDPRRVLNDCWTDSAERAERHAIFDAFPPQPDDDPEDSDYLDACALLEKRRSDILDLILLNDATNPNIHDYLGKTALHLAIREKNLEAAITLLSKGANPIEVDNEGLNALHYAARWGNRKIIKCVLTSVKDPTEFKVFAISRDKRGQNALHHLISSLPENTCLGYLLNESGIDVNETDDAGLSPLAQYLKGFCFTHTIELLIQHGASVSFTTNDEGMGLAHLYARHDAGILHGMLNVEILTTLEKHGVELQKGDDLGRTILHHSAISGCLTEEALLFLCHSVRLAHNSVDIHGKTPLDYAIQEDQEIRHPHMYDPGRWSRTKKVLTDFGESLQQPVAGSQVRPHTPTPP